MTELKQRFRRLIYSTRGVWLLLALGVLLLLKAATGIRVGMPLYIFALAIVLVAQGFRTWAAGHVGTIARERVVLGETLVTAGPYAFVRNPMYLGILVILLAFCLMSGLWYSWLIALGVYAFVYSKVIPYEEEYLGRRFKAKHEEYRHIVPRLWPTLKPYSQRLGRFDFREGLANEAVAIPGLLIVAALFYFV